MSESEFQIEAFGERAIPATFRSTELALSKGTIVFCHGISTDQNEYLNFLKIMAEEVSRIGFNSVRFDFAGHGKSRSTPSEFSIRSQVADLYSVISWIEDNHPNSKLQPHKARALPTTGLTRLF